MNCVFVSLCSRCLSLKQIWPTGHKFCHFEEDFQQFKRIARASTGVFQTNVSLTISLFNLSIWEHVHKVNSTLDLLMLSLSFPVLHGPEWRGVEEVRSGVSGQSQAGGAAIPDAESPRWGETRQVRGGGDGEEMWGPANKIFSLWVLMMDLLSRRANEDIAQVRAKANSDGTALTASLRKEQMKNDSLEQALQQKVPDTFFVSFLVLFPHSSTFPRLTPPLLCLLQNREIEELTKICDELIAKMGKIDWVTSSRGVIRRPPLSPPPPRPGGGATCMPQPSDSLSPLRHRGCLCTKKMQVTSCV